MIDKVVLHKHLGIPIFLVMMWGMFQFTFEVAVPFMEMIDLFFGWLGEVVAGAVSNEILASFLADGIIGGLGSVLIFVPNIFLLFFMIALLEDTGYLARAAFVMDRAMYKIGLHGRSFIPMLLGFGCNIPAMMAARSLDDEKDRILTILVNPLISCGARLPVYVLFAGAFFGAYAGTAIFSMYLLGIVLAILVSLLFRRTLFKGEPAPFILELPLYRRPTLHGTVRHMWERGVHFLKKAGGIIFVGLIIVWGLAAFPWGAPIEQSYVGQLGRALEPLVRPLGFDWRGVVALFFGFVAKEIVVGTYGVLFGLADEAAIGTALTGIMTPLSAFAFMAFVLIYTPCVAALGTAKKELGSWKWAGFLVAYELILAYVVAAVIIIVGGFFV
jgi:ferrous iron transport protein B